MLQYAQQKQRKNKQPLRDNPSIHPSSWQARQREAQQSRELHDARRRLEQVVGTGRG